MVAERERQLTLDESGARTLPRVDDGQAAAVTVKRKGGQNSKRRFWRRLTLTVSQPLGHRSAP